MANRLKMASVITIHRLLGRGWSQRRIARELGIDRGTVRRYARQGCQAPKAAGAPPGSAGPGMPLGGVSAPSKPATAPPGSTGLGEAQPDGHIQAQAEAPQAAPSQTSACEPFRELILAKLEKGLSATRIHQDLAAEQNFTAKYHSVRRFVKQLKRSRPLAFRRMECTPGEEAQIDFGTGAPVITSEGKRRRTHVFRIVLSHSRKAYSEAVFRQTTDDFIRCIENAFWHFGGVPRTLVVDNLKAAVIKADWFDPDLNPKLQSFCAHHGTVILPTKPRMPRHKGKIENQVGYVQDNCLKGLRFTSLQDQNRHLLEWETTVADTRIHGTTRRQVRRHFEEVERSALLPLPVERFPFFHEAERSVHWDGHVEVAKAYYSVPPEYLGHQVRARWDERLVRVFNRQMEQIALHTRAEPGKFSTDPAHIASEKISGVERGAAWLLNKVSVTGSHTQQWAEAMVKERGIQGVRVLQGLLGLANRHSPKEIERACEVAHSHGAYRLRIVRDLIKRSAEPATEQDRFGFIEEDPIIRNLSEYQKLVGTSFQRESLRREQTMEIET